LKRDSLSILRTTLEELRSVFLGIASRHDAVQSRWTIAEQGYDAFLSGPEDNEWIQQKIIAFRGFILREPRLYYVTEEQKQQILSERPDAKFGSYQGDSQIFYVEPLVNSAFYFCGNHLARDAFFRFSGDASFCLVQLLQLRQISLKLPELVPYESIGCVQARQVSTNLPSNLIERWLSFLHILGWQNLDLSPLRAERQIWTENTSIQGDPAKLQEAFDTPMFASLRANIPFPPRYFASTISTDLNLASVYAIDVLLNDTLLPPMIEVQEYAKKLASIEPGRDGAADFHAFVKDVLSIIFQPDLHSPICEDKLHEGRGRIDIVFTNGAERGYFADLPFRHYVKCPVVFFECKNYRDDIAGPEFSQLISRFSDRRSKAGFIVCRSVENHELIQKRCRDCFQARQEHVLVLEDADLLAMLKMKSQNDIDAISHYLRAKFHPVFMDV
jgi:hypothetical protein